jgi:hypothetical protein
LKPAPRLRGASGLDPVGIGAREPEVEEPVSGARSNLFEFEVDEVAEPKGLLPRDLRELVLRYGSHIKAAFVIGASEAFVRQTCRKGLRNSIKLK